MSRKSRSSSAEADLGVIAELQRDGRASWARIAQRLGVSESTASRRGTRLLQTGAVTIAAIPDPLRTGLGHPVLVALSTVPGQSRALARELAARSDVRFVTVLAGETDVLAEVIVPSLRDAASIVLEEIQAHPAVRSSRTETVLRTVKVSYDWSLAEGAAETPPAEWRSEVPPADDEVQPLDGPDSQLVMALNRDGRSTYAELAAGTGLTEAQVTRRVNALVERKAIVFATLVDPASMGYEVEAILYLKIDLPRLEDAANALAAVRSVRYIALTTGRFDVVAEVVLRDVSALLSFQLDVLAHLPGLRDHYVEIELDTVKRAFRSAHLETAHHPDRQEGGSS